MTSPKLMCLRALPSASAGSINVGAGDDVVTISFEHYSSAGVINGIIDGGAGNDTFTAGGVQGGTWERVESGMLLFFPRAFDLANVRNFEHLNVSGWLVILHNSTAVADGTLFITTGGTLNGAAVTVGSLDIEG